MLPDQSFQTVDAAPHQRSEPLRALDELFLVARQFSKRAEYKELLEFIARFRMYSPFNAMLVRIQMPGATFVAPPGRWRQLYGRVIRPGARPITILQPKGPVLFVFDVSDTEPLPNAQPLPKSVTEPFDVFGSIECGELARTIDNARRDGVRVTESNFGSQQSGLIRTTKPGQEFRITTGRGPNEKTVSIPVTYELLLNSKESAESRFATLVHELGHLYSGHLGTPNEKYWPDRRNEPPTVEECEAESISYIVCGRLGLMTNSASYVADYLGSAGEVPPISLDIVLKASGLILQMAQGNLPLRKDSNE
jgi:hypothetical protein